MEIKKVKAKASELDAVQFIGGMEHGGDIVDWILDNGGQARWSGEYRRVNPDNMDRQLVDRIQIETENTGESAVATNWIVQDPELGFVVYTNEAFLEIYNVVGAV